MLGGTYIITHFGAVVLFFVHFFRVLNYSSEEESLTIPPLLRRDGIHCVNPYAGIHPRTLAGAYAPRVLSLLRCVQNAHPKR